MDETIDPKRSVSEIDAEIVRLAKKKGELETEIGRWLVIAWRAGVSRKLGMGSYVEYVERRLGYSPRQAKEKIRIALRLERLPRIKAELEQGKLTTSVVRELVRVASPANEGTWVTAVDGLTVREVEKLVAGRKKGDLPSSPRDPLLERKRMIFDFSPEEQAIVIEGIERMRRSIGPHTTNAEAIRAMAEGVLGAGRAAADEAAYQVGVTVCTECRRTWRHAGGDAHDVPESVGACALCDGELAGIVEINEAGADAEPTHVGQEAMPHELTHVGQETTTDDVTHVGQQPTRSSTACDAGCVHSLIKRGGVRALLREASRAAYRQSAPNHRSRYAPESSRLAPKPPKPLRRR